MIAAVGIVDSLHFDGEGIQQAAAQRLLNTLCDTFQGVVAGYSLQHDNSKESEYAATEGRSGSLIVMPATENAIAMAPDAVSTDLDAISMALHRILLAGVAMGDADVRRGCPDTAGILLATYESSLGWLASRDDRITILRRFHVRLRQERFPLATRYEHRTRCQRRKSRNRRIALVRTIHDFRRHSLEKRTLIGIETTVDELLGRFRSGTQENLFGQLDERIEQCSDRFKVGDSAACRRNARFEPRFEVSDAIESRRQALTLVHAFLVSLVGDCKGCIAIRFAFFGGGCVSTYHVREFFPVMAQYLQKWLGESKQVAFLGGCGIGPKFAQNAAKPQQIRENLFAANLRASLDQVGMRNIDELWHRIRQARMGRRFV
jgi:hypothetical protein